MARSWAKGRVGGGGGLGGIVEMGAIGSEEWVQWSERYGR